MHDYPDKRSNTQGTSFPTRTHDASPGKRTLVEQAYPVPAERSASANGEPNNAPAVPSPAGSRPAIPASPLPDRNPIERVFGRASGRDASPAAPAGQAMAVQRRAAGPASEDVQLTAARGIDGPATSMPFKDQIQASFGARHDISSIRAHIGGAAGDAATAIGASAYATGSHAVFAGAPDLHTAAHEAAHVVQQAHGVNLYGGIGQVGDRYEQHADAVADRVVRGDSAADLLDGFAVGGGGSPDDRATAVQRKLNTTSTELARRWGNLPQALQGHFQALRAALVQYERAASIATIEAVFDALAALRATCDAMALPVPRITNQARTLANEVHVELDQLLRARAIDTSHRNATGQPETPGERIESAVGALVGGGDRQRDRRTLLRYQLADGFAGTQRQALGADDGPIILQSWKARGDMYHVGAVMNLYPQLEVVIYDLPAPAPGVAGADDFAIQLEYAERWKQACMIAGYYGQSRRVSYTHADGVAGRAGRGAAYDLFASASRGERPDRQRRMFIDVGGCTTILGLDLASARERGDYAARKRELARAVAPDPQHGDGRATEADIVNFLQANQWVAGTKYAIINFRASGHAQIEGQLRAAPQHRQQLIQGYDPARDQAGGNHPDLDTGVVGVTQLAAVVGQKGFTPVFMGEEPAGQAHPHLIRYWDFQAVDPIDGQLKKLCRGGRAAEAFFLRVLGESFDVRLLSMRSGVTDQLAFLGMPTLSIDVDNFHQAAAPELVDEPGYKIVGDRADHSWARGTKLEAGLQRDYGRVFISQPRDLKAFDVHDQWEGQFDQKDVATISDAVDFYFGTATSSAAPGKGVRHPSHPFDPSKLAATKKRGEADMTQQSEALSGRIDGGLNASVVLAHAKLQLEAGTRQGQHGAATALHGYLDYSPGGKWGAKLQAGDHGLANLEKRCEFLRSAVALLSGDWRAQDFERELADRELPVRTDANVTAALAELKEARDRVEYVLHDQIGKTSKTITTEVAALAQIDLTGIDRELAGARAQRPVEDAEQQRRRMRQIISKLQAKHVALRDLIAAGVRRLEPATSQKGKFAYKRLKDLQAMLQELREPSMGLIEL